LERPPASVRRSHCGYNLKAIAIALHTYHDDYQSLPPAYVCDENGKPMHSWRVLLLPYLEEQELYKRYDLNEPWDGPNNILLAPAITAVYQCPEESHQGGATVNYLAVLGPGTVWPGEKSLSFRSITDGMSSTIMVVEVASSGIQGSEPRDLDYSKLAMQINPQGGGGISSLHGKTSRHEASGAQVVFADGSVHFLSSDLKPTTLKLLLEANDGQPIGDY
jgi:prepilin-type processing-associated H-X9-DG protein